MIDVYSFGQLLYEMCFGDPLNAATCETFPAHCPPELREYTLQYLSSLSILWYYSINYDLHPYLTVTPVLANGYYRWVKYWYISVFTICIC